LKDSNGFAAARNEPRNRIPRFWVVDTCVLIDLLKSDPVFGRRSVRALQSMPDETLVIAPITYVELASAFKGDARAQDEFLKSIWVS